MPQGEGTYGDQVGRPPKEVEGKKVHQPSEDYFDYLIKLKDDERKRVYQEVMKDRTDRITDLVENKTIGQIIGGGVNLSERILSGLGGSGFEKIPVFTGTPEEEAFIEAAKKELSLRDKKSKGGAINEQMSMLMEEEQPMLPDEEMEEDYVEFVMDSALDEKDREYLESALAADGKLSEIFDTVVERASEFSGSGPIEGPGSGMSDSIPARLSDGEFVFTAKATEEIGADNLQRMMEDAEAGADQRLQAYGGGSIEEPQVDKVVETSTSTRVLKPTSSTTPMLGQREEDVLQEALTTNMLNRTTKHVQS